MLEQEERELNQLRKKLRIKTDDLPRSFRDDGLDCIHVLFCLLFNWLRRPYVL